MSTPLRRPWFTVTKTGSKVVPALEVVIGLAGAVVQVLGLVQGEPFTGQTWVVFVVAPLLVAQGVADLVWWSRDDRRQKAREALGR